jgi:pyrroline-5-carboxylate reductase
MELFIMRIALIGAGNMGEAILAGIHKKHVCLVCEPRPERQVYLGKKYRVKVGPLAEVVRAAEVVILAVKPQDFPELLAELAVGPVQGKLFVSIAAGITTKSLEKGLRQPARVIRVMPNLPALVGQGMSAVARGKRATPQDCRAIEDIFNTVGKSVVVKETMMDAVTAVSGSGPAYVFLFVECLVKAARKLGFTDGEARVLAYQTLLGSARMLEQSEDSAEALRLKVTSKGGTTQAATEVFFRKDIAGIFEAALKAARDRAKELSR